MTHAMTDHLLYERIKLVVAAHNGLVLMEVRTEDFIHMNVLFHTATEREKFVHSALLRSVNWKRRKPTANITVHVMIPR